VNSENDQTGIGRDFFEELGENLLFLDEFDVGQAFLGEFDSLVETILTTIRNIDNLDNLGLQSLIEHFGLVEFSLEIGTTGQNETANVGLVVGDEDLSGDFSDFSEVVMSLFDSQTGETD
jgi:hypothetical protein